MKPLHSFIVTASLPPEIEQLKELAYNYWWCWNSDAKELFNRMDRTLWEEVHHNPIMLINKLGPERLEELSRQTDFTSFLHYVHEKFQSYMESSSWFSEMTDTGSAKIAYFSPEYGINESFPNYSGGLGILSGDHLKSSSDLGLPLVGVGLLYQQGYFRQRLNHSGWQNEIYKYNDFFSLPIVLMRDGTGSPIVIDVDLPLGKAFAQIWKLQLGTVSLFLLDTNIDINGIEMYRDITDQLYGGDRETRIQQEMILGIGGMRALEKIGIEPEVIHINEGHAAFALLERTRIFMQKYSLDFRTAKQITRGSSVFTTHTPVPAGNETFRQDRMDNYFRNYPGMLGLSREEFLELGHEGKYNNEEKFSMTVLGLRLTSYHNGVSKLHGEVSRNMWQRIWKCFPTNEIPIGHVTNGIHTQTWVSREFTQLFDRYLSPTWRIDTDNPDIWEGVDNIPSEELYREKQRRRVRLVLYVREYLSKRPKSYLNSEQLNQINEFLNTDALTIGFARRFATYKRAQLLFSDMEKLTAILKNIDSPVQIIIAGKAHPHDIAGKEVIQSIIQKVKDYGLERHVVFLEDYDMVIARLMVKGCDIWLNTPVRPMEASGTSGMKAALNGTLNLSILDGWWDEAFNGLNGFAIGNGQEYGSQEEQNNIESGDIYDILENTIIPMFYDRSRTGVPQKWVNYMKNCIKTIAPEFSTTRMIRDYATKYYIPALANFREFSAENADKARELRTWKDKIKSNWERVEVIDASIIGNGEVFVGKEIKVSAVVALGDLSPDDVLVQVYYGSIDSHGNISDAEYSRLERVNSQNDYHHFEGIYVCPGTGMQGFTIRVLPTHPLIVEPASMYLCAWA